MTNDSLAKAIAHLGAVEVAPGRYAWHTKRFPYTSGAWLTANSDYLLEVSYDGVEIHEKFATLMPEWWTPGQRFASFDGDTLKATGSSKTAATLCDTRAEAPIYGAPLPYRLITADLETGAEVPA